MKKSYFFFLWLFFHHTLYCQPLPQKTHYNVIIDTDCALDDLRSIVLMVSCPLITVKGIVTSEGSLSAVEGYEKVNNLITEFNSRYIPLGCGKCVKGILPPWRPFAESIHWGHGPETVSYTRDAVIVLDSILLNSEEKIILVCLGALTNVDQLLQKYPSSINKIERIIWYNESVKPMRGFNYECDKHAAESVFQSGVRIDVISNLEKKEDVIDHSFLDVIKESDSFLSCYLNFIYTQPPVQEKLNQNHLTYCDDLIPVYITNAELFDISREKENPRIRYNRNYDPVLVREVMFDMIKGTYRLQKNVVFTEFPEEKGLFAYDVRQIMDSVISKYGIDEWKANVMTDEFHGHLGVFSIVGAKMGIMAREIFGVGPDMLNVTSFAGSRPPYSCLNDGIQVSTGATLGMGTIHLASDSVQSPSAIFTFKGRSVKITLKSEYLEKVNQDINEGIVKFGLTDDGYWKLIRRNAIQYWLNWDRNKIFDIKEL